MDIVSILSYAAVFMFAVGSTKLGLYDSFLQKFVEGVRETVEPVRYPKPLAVADPEPITTDILTY